MTIPSRLDRNTHPSPPRWDPCLATFPLDGGGVERCVQRNGHVGPHVAQVTVTWERLDQPEIGHADDAPRI